MLLACLLIALNANAQINIQNGSFEKTPTPNIPPVEWESWNGSPDIQPGAFCVSLLPFDGGSYLGLVYGGGGAESVAQLLTAPLKANQTYRFTVTLSKTNSTVPNCGGNGLGPSRFRIWGCNYRIFDPVPDEFLANELLWQSDTINHVGWVEYSGTFTPDSNYTYLRLDCIYLTEIPSKTYLLIDKLSNLEEVHPQVWINSPRQTDTLSCTSIMEIETDSIATSVILYSSLLNQTVQASKVNDTSWQYTWNYPRYLNMQTDSIITIATFAQNYKDTARVVIKVACIEEPAVYFWQPNTSPANYCQEAQLKIRTDSLASSVELYSVLLNQRQNCQKLNDTLWLCDGFSYSHSDSKDTLIALGYYSSVHSDTLTIKILCDDFINQIPNLITPNSDGKNDFFEISNHQHYDLHLKVYNRWGDQIYENKGYKSDWPTNQVVDGIYYYLIEYKDMEYKGWLEILK